MRKYNLEENDFMKRIFKYRAKWAKPYFMHVFCAGMTSTQRSESANHMLKQFIQRSAPMHMFVRKFNEFQVDRNGQEEKEVHVTKQMRRKRRIGVPIERHAELNYTRRIYEKFYNELYYFGAYSIKSRTKEGVFEVAHSSFDGHEDQFIYKVKYEVGSNISCSCGLFEHLGLLCRHSLKVLVHCDVKEIPAGNLMLRWMKDDRVIGDGSDTNSGLHRLAGADDVLKKRAIVNSLLQVAYCTNPISEELFVEVMGAMDRASAAQSTEASSGDDMQALPRHSATVSYMSQNVGVPIRCPDRPSKKGRPSNTSLQSWTDEQKRKGRDNTDEENPKRVKTRRLVDVLAI